MPTRTEAINGTSVDMSGISCVSGEDIFRNNARNYNQVSTSMEEKRKEVPTNSTQQTATLHPLYSMTDGFATHRFPSRRQSNRDEIVNQDDIIQRVSRSQSARRSRTMPDIFRRGSVPGSESPTRLFNMSTRNVRTCQPRRRSMRPITALGFSEKATLNANTYPGRPDSRSAAPSSVQLDPDIPITSNWAQTGIKNLNEDKVQDLYRRYLGREYRVQTATDETSEKREDEDEDEENERDQNTNNNIGEWTVSPKLDLGNNITEVAADTSDVNVGDKDNQDKEKGPDVEGSLKKQLPTRRPSIEFSLNQVSTLEKARKSMIKFRKSKLQEESRPSIEVETPNGTIHFPHTPRRRQPKAPTLKVACSVEFETAFKGLNVS